jgi:5'-nucleotidase
MSEKFRVLVDMDGVLADFDKRLAEVWKQKYPEDPTEKLLDREIFDIPDMQDFVPDAEAKLKSIYLKEGFYGSLEPIANGLGFIALKQMVSLGNEVYILTSAGSKAMYAPTEKFIWVRDNMGPEWVSKIIVSKDKHIIDGDILIDDKPNPNGEEKGANWEHVIYDQPFNRHVTNKRRITWHNWAQVLPELTK